MKKNLLKTLAILLLFSLFSCINSSDETAPDARFIQGITKGEISSYDEIVVIFTEDLGLAENTTVKSPFDFSPSIEGQAYWKDDYTLAFKPEQPLPGDTSYTMRVNPEKLGRMDIEPFQVNLKTIIQEYRLDDLALSIPEAAKTSAFVLETSIETADWVEKKELLDQLSIDYGGKEIPFTLSGKDVDTKFILTAQDIPKLAQITELTISINKGTFKGKEKLLIDVPAQGTFSVLPGEPRINGDGSIEIFFSDALRADQNLYGLIQVEGMDDLQIRKNGNSLKLFAGSKWPTTIKLMVNDSIQNNENTRLDRNYSTTLRVPTEKPQLRFLGSGAILPTTQGATIPIETMNLNTIMVEAVRVHGQNMTQFLQNNNLDGTEEIHRVGEVVWQKIIDLDWNDENIDTWVRYGLDLSPLADISTEGLIQLRVTFRHPHIEYPCSAPADEQTAEFLSLVPEVEAENSFWDNWETNYNYNYRRQRFDPCHPAYYQKWNDHNISITRNVLISNVGIIARQSTDNKLHVAVSDLRSASPQRGATVEVYNFQNRVIKKTITNRNGFADIDLERETPFYIKVEDNGHYGYLKVDQGNAISVSHFDVGGVRPQKGVQGFIYGERDVWRPGDTIHLTMILSDPMNTIPEDHPVSLEFYDPFGKKIQTHMASNENGFYYVPISTRSTFTTGTYKAKYKIGSMSFEKDIRLEMVVPNRLKIDLSFDSEEEYFSNGSLEGDISAKWLHGAIAGSLKSDIKMTLSSVPTVFSNFQDYTFDDQTRDFTSRPVTIFDGTLDEQGSAHFTKNLSIQNAPGKLRANMVTRVFETGGAFSTEYTSRPYHPYETYVGMKLPKGDVARGMLLTDTDHTVDIVLADKDGNSVRNGTVTAEFYKIEWRWWWETDQENLTGFTSRRSTRKLASGEVNIVNGRGQWEFSTNYPDWGRYYIRVVDNDGGHSAGQIVYIDWPGWAGRAQDEGAQGVSMLMLNSDKQGYNVGEEIKINIPGGEGGQCFITIENGGQIVKSEWISAQGNDTVYTFEATPDMAPNIYVHATYTQPHMQSVNDRPIRSYGIIPISVDDPASRLEPVISCNDEFRPGSAVRIRVSENQGKEMTYTLAIVDEGLLGLTNFNTPNPWNYVFRKRASLLRSFDVYKDVIGAFSGSLDTLLAIGGGGDGGGDGAGGRKANRFEPVVIFEEPRTVEAGKTQSHIIKIPEYIGAVRVMVIAAGDNTFGKSDKFVPVKKELMVQGSLPRVLGVGEEIDFPVSIFALDESISRVDLEIETSGPLTIDGTSSRTVQVSTVGEYEENFKLRTSEIAGVGEIIVRASAGRFTAESKVEIDIRSPAVEVTEITNLTIQAGAKNRSYVTLPGIAGTNEMSIEVAQMQPINMAHRLDYLIRYPHGCIEQTTSGAFPQLYLNTLMRLDQEKLSEIDSNMANAIERIKLFQTNQGGFSYWPGQSQVNAWGTNYAGHYLVEARKKGYSVPENLYDNWVNYQKTSANSWDSNDSQSISTQAYRLYTLALAGEADLAAMNRLEAKNLSRNNLAKWRLALAYSISGQHSTARSLTQSRDTSVPSYTELSGTFGSTLRDKAMILEALIDMDESTGIRSLVQDISQVLSSDQSLSTQTTAYSLIAMSKYGVYQQNRDDMTLAYRWAGNENIVSSNRPMIMEEVNVTDRVQGSLEIENLGSDTLYPRLIMKGVPMPGQETALSQGLELTVTYKDMDGRRISLNDLEPGADIKIQVQVTNKGYANYEEMVLTHMVPSGWEIHNSRLSGSGGSGNYDYIDIRDDRVYTYFDLNKNRSKTFTLIANISYTGTYYLPMIIAEAMYDPEIVAIKEGRWLTIR